MKVSDAIRECIFYPYSKDHYELTEMCYRISLMEQFVENQRFISSIHDRTSAVMYESGAFGERIDEDIIEQVITEASEDKVTVWNRIQMGAHKMVQWIKDMFFKIAVRFDKSIKQAKEINQKLNDTKIGKDLYNKMNKVCLDALDENKQDGHRFIPYKDQPFKADLHFLNDVTSEQQAELTSRVSAALSDTKVKAEAGAMLKEKDQDGNEKEEQINAIPPTDLVNELYDFVKGDNVSVENLNSKLRELGEKTGKDGLEIEVNPAAVKDMAARLSKISNQMETIQAKTKSRSGSSSSDDKKDESQTESYWYDFYPEYLYEGFYDDWDPIYGDPFDEVVTYASDNKASYEVQHRRGLQNIQNNRAKHDIEQDKGKTPAERTFRRIVNNYNSSVKPLKNKHRAVEYNNALKKFRENWGRILRKQNLQDSDLPKEVRILFSEKKTPFMDERSGISDDVGSKLTSIKKKIVKLHSIYDDTKAGKGNSKPPQEYIDLAKEIQGEIKSIQSIKNLSDGEKSILDSANFKKVMNISTDNSSESVNNADVQKFQNSQQVKDFRQLEKIIRIKNLMLYTADRAEALAGEKHNKQKANQEKQKLGRRIWNALKTSMGWGELDKIEHNARKDAADEFTKDKKNIEALSKLLKDKSMTWKKLEAQDSELAKFLGDINKVLQKYKVVLEAHNKLSGEKVDIPQGEGSSGENTSGGNQEDTSQETPDTSSGEDVKNLNAAYAILKQRIGVVMHIYLGYTKYREKVIGGLSDVLNLGENSSNDNNENDNEEEEEAS